MIDANRQHGKLIVYSLLILIQSVIATELNTSKVPFDEVNLMYNWQVEGESFHLLKVIESEFYPGGVYNFDIEAAIPRATIGVVQKRSMLQLLVCSDEEYAAITKDGSNYCTNGMATDKTICKKMNLYHTDLGGVFFKSKSKFLGVIESSRNVFQTMHFVFASCELLGGQVGKLMSCLNEKDENSTMVQESCFRCQDLPSWDRDECIVSPRVFASISIEVKFQLCSEQNTGCLGKEHEFIPLVYVILIGVWVIGTMGWLSNIALTKASTTELQQYMTIIPLCKITILAVKYGAWTMVNNAGTISEIATFYKYIGVVAGITNAVSDTIMLLIARGWKITRPTITLQEKGLLTGIALIWGSAWYILKSVPHKSTFNLLLWCCVYIIVLYCIWYSAAVNLLMLGYQIELIASANIDPKTTPVYTKWVIFQSFRMAYAVYLVAACTRSFLLMFDDVRNTWWSPVLEETMLIVFYFYIAHLFRCRRFEHTFHVTFTTGPNDDVRFGAVITQPNQSGLVPVPWKEGMPMPNVPKKLNNFVRRNQVIVLQPDDDKVLGTTRKWECDADLSDDEIRYDITRDPEFIGGL